MRGFSEQDIHSAKELLFEVSSGIAALKNIRKKNRKNTSYKKKVEGDVKDVLHLCYEADRLKADLPKSGVVDINSFPVIPLEEDDCSNLLSKVSANLNNELEGVVIRMSEQVSLCEKRIKELGEVITDGKKSQVSRNYSEVLKVSSVQNPNSVQPQSAGVIDEKGDDVVKRNSNNTDNDQERSIVERLRRRNIKAVVSSNKEVSSLVGVERRRRDTSDIYVGNLKKEVTELRIVE